MSKRKVSDKKKPVLVPFNMDDYVLTVKPQAPSPEKEKLIIDVCLELSRTQTALGITEAAIKRLYDGERCEIPRNVPENMRCYVAGQDRSMHLLLNSCQDMLAALAHAVETRIMQII